MRTLRTAILALSLLSLVVGCGSVPRARIGKVEAAAPADPGKPASVSSDITTTELPIPQGSTMDVHLLSLDTPPIQRLQFSRDTTLRTMQERQSAQTGTVDTAVATRRADNQARQPLLYAAIGAVALAVPCVIYGWPIVGALCAAAGAAFFAAWQAAGLPPWFPAFGLAGLMIAGGIYLGYKRREAEGEGSARG